MYQPRRADGPAADSSATVSGGPANRAEQRWYAVATDRVGQLFLGLAITGTIGALAIAGTASAAPIAAPVTTPDPSVRASSVSREEVRPQIAAEDALALEAATESVATPALEPTRTMYAKKPVTVIADPKADAKKVATVKVADKLTVTPRTSGKYRLVTYKKDAAWVLQAALSNTKPTENEIADVKAPAAARKVPAGSVLGLQPEAMVVYRAVMARWAVKNVGGWRAHSRSVHQFGRAIDFMTYADAEQGYAIRNFVIAHYKEFGIDHVIFRQHIWTPYNQKWRLMEDRGNPTDNHMDHVHVAVKER